MTSLPKYTEEFKREAIKLVLEKGYTRAKACQNLGISKSALDNWLRQHKMKQESELSDSDQELFRRLKKENQELRMERDILKEAAVYFAGESKKSIRS